MHSISKQSWIAGLEQIIFSSRKKKELSMLVVGFSVASTIFPFQIFHLQLKKKTSQVGTHQDGRKKKCSAVCQWDSAAALLEHTASQSYSAGGKLPTRHGLSDINSTNWKPRVNRPHSYCAVAFLFFLLYLPSFFYVTYGLQYSHCISPFSSQFKINDKLLLLFCFSRNTVFSL